MIAIRVWYRRRTRRQRALIRWGGPLLLALVVVQADWLYRHYSGVASVQTGRSLLIRVGALLAVSMVVKLALTRGWTVQDVGIVLTIFGSAGLMVRIIGRWGPQPVSEPERDYIHSLLEVGGTILLGGIVLVAVSRVRRAYRRWRFTRPGFDRRKGDRRQSPPSSGEPRKMDD
jgi:hypothetical protein